MNVGYSNEIWDAVRAMWEAGNSAHSIGNKDGFPCKQAICVKAKEEGWERIDEVDNALEFIPFDGLTEQQCIVVREVSKGLSQRLAAALVGVNESTVSDWKKTNPEFAKAVLAATGVIARRQIGKITASEDWRAATWLLERHPETRKDYAPPTALQAPSGPTFNVLGQVHVGLERQAIDVTPERQALEA